jgi:hypothetical protein
VKLDRGRRSALDGAIEHGAIFHSSSTWLSHVVP